MLKQRRISRPWDRKGIGRFETRSTSSPPVSSIQVDGVVYKSDRFYLNRAVDDPPIVMPPNGCSCGARSPPPLLDVERLVASLDLKAAILASYTLDLKYMQRKLHSLFDPQSVVPTLVLHGHKGLGERMIRAAKEKTAGSNQGKISNYSPDERHSKRPRVVCKTDQDITHIYDSSDEEGVMSAAHNMFKTDDEGRLSIKEEEPPEEALLRTLDEAAVYDDIALGPCVHLTEILPAWVPEHARQEIETRQKASKSDEKEVIVLDSDDEETHAEARCSLDPLVVQRRKVKVGVHHPKFMILFETSGSVVVVVSTSNLTPQHTVDGSWVQRFERSQTDKKSEIDDAMRCNGSDFGHVLANYLECQSNAAREDQMLPETFLRQHVGIASLESFGTLYRFEDSQVHLIATVPGNYKGRERATHLRDSGGSKSFLYGSQRVNDILHRLSGSSPLGPQVKPWLPRSFLSHEDRLVIQPTSFGGNWKQENLTDLIRLYFEHGITDTTDTSFDRTERFLGQTDILWPTLEYMNEVNQNGSQVRVPSPDSVANAVLPNDTIATASGKQYGSVLFLSSIAFNTIDLACLSRMSMFEPSTPSQMITNRSPHIKSFARVFEGNEYQLRKDYGVEKAEEFLSWFLLTSACLSRGAQGEAAPLRGFDSDEMTYSNFELGVLFVSRLQGDKQSDRLYCWKPSQCHDNQARKSSVEMIHLPIPYCIRPRSYHADDQEAEMCATPYFHEIPPGTGFVGQMRLTPLGVKLAAAQL